METLLEDYKRKLENVKELIEKQRSNGCIVHQRREERLNTKAAEYRAFIVDIERAMARQQQQSSANCAIFDVSGSVFTIEDMRKAYNAGVSRGVDNINKPTVDWTLNWHRNMFDRWFKEHYR